MNQKSNGFPLLTYQEGRFLSTLTNHGVRYLVVGSHAKRFHGLDLAPNDLDVYVGSQRSNLEAVLVALDSFDPVNYTRTLPAGEFPRSQLRVPVGPGHADILTGLTDSLEFGQAWQARVPTEMDGVPVTVISRADLIRHLQASDRDKDLAHADELAGVR